MISPLYMAGIRRLIYSFKFDRSPNNIPGLVFRGQPNRTAPLRLTPQLSRVLLSQEVEIRKDGFYLGEEKLASSSIGEKFAYPQTVEVVARSPEALVEYVRAVEDLGRIYQETTGKEVFYALFNLLGVCSSVEQLNWTRDLIYDFYHRFGDAYNYVGEILPLIMYKSNSLEQLRAWDWEVKVLLSDFEMMLDDLGPYTEYALPVLIDNVKSPEELRLARPLILDYIVRVGNPVYFVESILTRIFMKTRSAEEIEQWCDEVIHLALDYNKRFADPEDQYVSGTISDLVENAKTLEVMRAARSHILDHRASFNTPGDKLQIELLMKSNSVEELNRWNETVRFLTSDYQSRFGEPAYYLEYALPKLLEIAGSPAELRLWDIEAKSLVLNYRARFGDLKLYLRYVLPGLLEYSSTFKELRQRHDSATYLIADYKERFDKHTPTSEYIRGNLFDVIRRNYIMPRGTRRPRGRSSSSHVFIEVY